jgi:hypothetical protein
MNCQAYLIKEAMGAGRFLRILKSQLKGRTPAEMEVTLRGLGRSGVGGPANDALTRVISKSLSKKTPQKYLSSIGSSALPLEELRDVASPLLLKTTPARIDPSTYPFSEKRIQKAIREQNRFNSGISQGSRKILRG